MEVCDEYKEFVDYWKQIRIFTRGLKDVKKYIQDVTTSADENGQRRNKHYKDRAVYVNFPVRTRNAFTGAVFRKPAVYTLPTQLEYLIDDVDGADLSLEHLAKSCVSNVVEVGRHGLFIDYGETQAKIVQYTAENIIDWEVENGKLVEVMLQTDDDDYKKLYIDTDGFYAVDIIEDTDESDEEPSETIYPTRADGSRFDYIPFVFVGSINNSPDIDDMPLWAIVDLTRGHLQNSADMEDIAKYMIPTPAVTAPNASWVKEMLPSGVYTFGDGSIIPLPDGGTATLLQAQENQMHSKLMEQKENQLIKIGARIMTGESTANKTAEATKIEYSSENSVLDNLVGNVSAGIKWALEVCAEFMGATGATIEYELNRDFYESTANPQLILAAANLLDRQIIGPTDLRDYARRVGLTDRTDEEIDAELANYGSGL